MPSGPRWPWRAFEFLRAPNTGGLIAQGMRDGQRRRTASWHKRSPVVSTREGFAGLGGRQAATAGWLCAACVAATLQVTEWRGAHPLAAESTRIP